MLPLTSHLTLNTHLLLNGLHLAFTLLIEISSHVLFFSSWSISSWIAWAYCCAWGQLMAHLYISGYLMSRCVANTTSLGSVEFALWKEVARMCSRSILMLNVSFWSIKMRKAKSFWSSFQLLLSSLASHVMSISISSVPGGDLTLFFIFDIGLTVCPARVYFGSLVGNVGFWHLTGSSVALWAYFLILISSSKVVDFDEEVFSLTSNSWISLNVGFPAKYNRTKSVFTVVSSKICKSLTLMTLFCSSIWTLQMV